VELRSKKVIGLKWYQWPQEVCKRRNLLIDQLTSKSIWFSRWQALRGGNTRRQLKDLDAAIAR